MSSRIRPQVFALVATAAGGCLFSDLDALQEGSVASSGATTGTTTSAVAAASSSVAASTATSGGTGGAGTGGGGTGGTGGSGTGGAGTGGTGGAGGGCGDAIDLLSDADNCGSCGHDCLGGDCVDGVCQPFVLASGLAEPRYLVDDGTHLFVSDEVASLEGGYFRVAKDEPEDVLRLVTQPGALALALRGDELLYTAHDQGDGIYAIAKDGSGEERLLFESKLAIEIAIDPDDPTTLFVAEYSVSSSDRILRVEDDGKGDVILLAASSECEAMRYHDGRLYVGGEPVRRVNPDGTGLATLIERKARRIAVDDDSVYLTGYSTNELWAVDLDGTNERVIATGEAIVASGDIAVDATHVYWSSTFGLGSIMRADKTAVDATAEVLAEPQPHADGILVDDEAIYWVTRDDGEPGSGRIMKLAK